MKIPNKGRHALRLMLGVAERQPQECAALKDAPVRQEISRKHLEQIALLLTRAGALRAVRGHQGGYPLTRAAHGGRNPPRHGRRARAGGLFGAVLRRMRAKRRPFGGN